VQHVSFGHTAPTFSDVQVLAWRGNDQIEIVCHISYKGDASITFRTELQLNLKMLSRTPFAALPVELTVSDFEFDGDVRCFELCLCVSLCVSVSLCLCVSVSLCLCVTMSLCLCVSLYLPVSLSHVCWLTHFDSAFCSHALLLSQLLIRLQPDVSAPRVSVSLVDMPFIDFDLKSEIGHTVVLKDRPHIRNIIMNAMMNFIEEEYVLPKSEVFELDGITASAFQERLLNAQQEASMSLATASTHDTTDDTADDNIDTSSLQSRTRQYSNESVADTDMKASASDEKDKNQ
jgi:Maintenance of mitochondrial morphology protein 1